MGKFWLPGDTPPKEWKDPEPDPNRLILQMNRGGVQIQFTGRTIWILGDMLNTRPPESDFLLQRSSIRRWDPPFEGEHIDEATRQQIIDLTVLEMRKEGWRPEVV